MVHVLISGYVQGVGYRYFVKRLARKLGIKGFVKNLPDGRVEAVFQGDEKLVKKLIEACKRGPLLAVVKDIQIKDEPDSNFETFEMLKK